METERKKKGVKFGEKERGVLSAMIEFGVEDILFEEMEAAAAAAAAAAASSAETSGDAAAAARPGLILPSMTIDPADTKTPYSDATQVGTRKGGRSGRRAAAAGLCRAGSAPQLAPGPPTERPTA